MNINKKTFLVTGATGFAAPHLMNLLLNEGHDVYALTRRTNGMQTDVLDVIPLENFEKIKWLVADFTDREAVLKIFRQHKFDGVFHLGAMSLPPQSFVDPVGTFRDNLMGTINLLDAVEQTQGLECKFMLCSTSEVYGNAGSDGRLIKETEPMNPANPYGASKAAAELFMQERMKNGKINGFITRAFSHTGPRRGKNFSISSDAFQIAQFMIEKAKRASFNSLSETFPKDDKKYNLLVGNLSTTRVVIDVRDCVMSYYLLMTMKYSSGQIFNVCGDTPYKMETYTDILIACSKLRVEKVIHQPFWREHEIFYQHGDSSELKALTGWKPKFSIEQTLSDLLNYWVAKLHNNS